MIVPIVKPASAENRNFFVFLIYIPHITDPIIPPTVQIADAILVSV